MISEVRNYYKNFGLKLTFLRVSNKLLGKYWPQPVRDKYFKSFYNFYKQNCKNTINAFCTGKIKSPKLPIYERGKEPIWMLWWQGEKNMPLLVKRCIESVKRNSNGHPVYVLNKDTYEKYIKLPKFVLKKSIDPEFKLSFLSDIIRMSLLEEYGGLWLDSTILVMKPIPQKVFERSFFSLDYADSRYCHGGIWSGFILSGKENEIFSFCKNALYEYWENNNMMAQYFGIDYIMLLAYNYIPKFKKSIDTAKSCGYNIYILTDHINDNYDTAFWNKVKENTFYKIDRRQIKGKSGILNKILES